TNATSMPLFAATSVMPDPIRPHPITPTFFTSSGFIDPPPCCRGSGARVSWASVFGGPGNEQNHPICFAAMPEVTSFDGVRLSAHVLGQGEPVTVMGHGLTSTYRDFEIFAPFVPGTKVLFDFRGHGDSECPPPGSYTTEHFAQDVEAVAKEYDATCAAGVSLGTGAILRLLTTQPDRFERIVLLLPGRVPVHPQVKERLFHLADLLERHSVEETADIIVAEEEAAGAYDQFP